MKKDSNKKINKIYTHPQKITRISNNHKLPTTNILTTKLWNS